MNRFLNWAKREFSLRRRLLVMIPAGVFFLGLMPYVLIMLLPKIDRLLQFPNLYFGVGNILLASIFILLGGYYALWSIGVQIFDASGTPLPFMPTQKLVVFGPFRQCRNPMTFGTICAYSGVGILIGSITAILTVLILGSLLILYIRNIEEKELEARFGQAYVDYKATTPFTIPRFWEY